MKTANEILSKHWSSINWRSSKSNYDAAIDAMEEYAKYYHEQQVKSVDLADVGGSLRELADKYEKDALERYEKGDHTLSHLHMAAQARYGFEDGWNAAKKQ